MGRGAATGYLSPCLVSLPQRASLRGTGADGLVGFIEESLGFFDVGAQAALDVPDDFLRVSAGGGQGVIFLEVGIQFLQATLQGGPVRF